MLKRQGMMISRTTEQCGMSSIHDDRERCMLLLFVDASIIGLHSRFS